MNYTAAQGGRAEKMSCKSRLDFGRLNYARHNYITRRRARASISGRSCSCSLAKNKAHASFVCSVRQCGAPNLELRRAGQSLQRF